MQVTKIKRIYATEKGKNVYPIIVRENQHSNQVALQGLSEVEISQLADYLVRMRKNVSEDWEFVKREHSKLLRKGRLIDGRNKTINNRRCTSVTRNQH